MHWVLLAADVQRGEVTVLDSMGGNNTNLAQKWMQYMQIRSAKTGELGNKIWTDGKLVSCRQEDGNSYCAFVLLLPCVNIASSPNEDFICPVCKAQYY
ncbi:uncharacterized protein [Argopecten irradians]|uniref:uncharacterized protein n=1 Tax=Argopecten irradians TaxID=31199 RepID=UPI003720A988